MPASERPATTAPALGRPRVDWGYTLKTTLREFSRDQLTDRAAALTYYSILSLFPALIALVSILTIAGQGGAALTPVLDQLAAQGLLPPDSSVTSAITDVLQSAPAPGLGLGLGLLTALWSASNYVKAFGRAMNVIYDVPEGRPFVKLNLQMFALTAVLLVLLAVGLLLVTVSGPLVTAIGAVLNVSEAAQATWNALKTPGLIAVAVLIVALLYYFTPNVRPPRVRLISVGAFAAIVIAGLASTGFGIYVTVAASASYAKTYGTLAGAILFLFWVWIMNIALLLGGELDAELERGRELRQGLVAEDQIQLPARDLSAVKKAEAKALEVRQLRRQIRFSSGKGPGVNGGLPGYVADGVAADRVRRANATRAAREAREAASEAGTE